MTSRRYRTLGDLQATVDDPYAGQVGAIGFVLHRRRPSEWSIDDHANPHLDVLAMCQAGRAHYACSGVQVEVTPGTMLLFHRQVRHSAWSDVSEPWSFYAVGFELRGGDGAAGRRLSQLPWHARPANSRQVLEEWTQLHRTWTGRLPGYSLACRGIIHTLMHHYIVAARRQQPNVPHARRLEQTLELLHANVGRIFAVEDLARRAGLSASRFRVLFRRHTGCSVTRYQNRLRIAAAADLLRSGQYSVTDAADEMGFRDVYYFSRLFKRITGMPPSAWRG